MVSWTGQPKAFTIRLVQCTMYKVITLSAYLLAALSHRPTQTK